MPQPLIRADYVALEQIAQAFADEAQRIVRVCEVIDQRLTRLKRDGWVADAADEFYRGMDNDVIPGLYRLRDGMKSGASAAHDIMRILKDAEDEAAACLRGDITEESMKQKPTEKNFSSAQKNNLRHYDPAFPWELPGDEDDPLGGLWMQPRQNTGTTAIIDDLVGVNGGAFVTTFPNPEEVLGEQTGNIPSQENIRDILQGVLINRPPSEEELGNQEDYARQAELWQQFQQTLQGGILTSDEDHHTDTNDVDASSNPTPNQSISPYYVRIDPEHPGRPDPEWSIDTATFDPEASTASTTRHGEILDQQQFWSQWRELDLETERQTLSERNLQVIEAGYSPVVDQQWIEYFPEHAPFIGQTIEHHHVNYGQYAIPLPRELHRGAGNFNIWH